MNPPPNFEHQIELAHFPADAQVTVTETLEGLLVHVERGGRTGEALVTLEAQKMYGVAPALAVVLTQLREAAERGLPAEGEHMVMLGD